MQLPSTKVTLAPEANTKVNLPTWAWLDKAVFDDVQATAALNVPGFNIQATTTAKPVSLKLEPGTEDAVTYPASGECVINADNSIGEPYAKGKADPAVRNPLPPFLRRRHVQAPCHSHLGDHLNRHGQPQPDTAPQRHLRQRPGGNRPGDPVGQPVTGPKEGPAHECR